MSAQGNPRTPGFLQGIMLLLPATMAVMGITVLTPVVHLMLEQWQAFPHHDYLVIGGILTMPAIFGLLFSPVAGWMTDRFGRRNLLVFSMVIYAFLGATPALLDNPYLIVLSRAGVGICEAIVMTASTTLLGDYFQGRTRERWMASQTAVASVSAVGIIYLGGVLGSAYGWRGPFFLYLYSLPLALAVLACIWEPAPRPVDTATLDVPAPGTPAPDAVAMIPWPRTLSISTLVVLASICFYTVITKNAEALVSLGVSDPAAIGKLTMLASIGVPLGSFIYWGVARLSIGWLLSLDYALIGCGFILMGHAPTPTAYAIGSFINQVGCGIVLPTMLVWATRGVPYGIRGRVTGIFQATFAIGQFLSGMLVTLLGKELGGLLPTLGVMGRAAVGAAVIAAIAGLIGRAPSRAPVTPVQGGTGPSR